MARNNTTKGAVERETTNNTHTCRIHSKIACRPGCVVVQQSGNQRAGNVAPTS